MTRVLFVCHGNICRSPMAELIFKDMIKKIGIEKEFFMQSSATSTEEIWGDKGNPAEVRTVIMNIFQLIT